MKFFNLKIAVLFFLISCNQGNYSISGTVKNIEIGKDGYTAIIVNNEGKEFDITIRRTDMGARYRRLTVGDNVKVYGDSSNYKNRISIKVTKIDD